jgi:UDP-2,4-diacetamido-2,4,6-trideoxy-beta-L-altropyranose hydrolase
MVCLGSVCLWQLKGFLVIKLRQATLGDCDLLFEWRNDPLAVKYSLTSASVEYKPHCDWLSNKLSDKNCLLLIAEYDNIPCGQIRFDYTNDSYLISFSVAKEFRGKGLSIELLSEGVKFNKRHFKSESPISALVAVANEASCKAFVRAGFSMNGKKTINQKECLEYRIK